jgi:hypothetical protein
LGPSWRSTVWGWLTLFFGWVYFDPETFQRFPLLVSASKYLAVISGAQFARKVQDPGKTT